MILRIQDDLEGDDVGTDMLVAYLRKSWLDGLYVI